MTIRRASAATVLLAVVAGCSGPRSAGPSAESGDQPVARPSAVPAVDASDLPPAGRTAFRYAVAARSWTAANYSEHHRRQLRLSTGPLRRTLAQSPPSRDQIAMLRADRARLDARVVSANSVVMAPTQARFRLVLDERSVAAGQAIRERAIYLVDLRRRPGGRWRVAGFTAVP